MELLIGSKELELALPEILMAETEHNIIDKPDDRTIYVC